MTALQEWHKWRSRGIGASDSPIIMGVSPWKTPHQLWLEKTGQVKPNYEANFRQARGIKLEPVARAMYELEVGFDCPPSNHEHPGLPFVRASLDGYNSEHGVVLEIKCPGKDDHASAREGKVPDKYFPQIQHQLYVVQAGMAHYYSFDGKTGVLVECPADHAYIKKLVEKLVGFWGCVTTKKLTFGEYSLPLR